MRRLCAFIGFPYRPALVEHFGPQRRTPRTEVVIDDRVRELCGALEDRLRATYLAQTARIASAAG